jgi:hypothetical protein
MFRASILFVIAVCSWDAPAQDIYLVPFKKLNVSEKEITTLSISEQNEWLAASDAKGITSIRTIESNQAVTSLPAVGPVLHDFLNQSKSFLLLDQSGKLITYQLDTKETKNISLAKGVKVASFDPNQQYITVLNKEDVIEIYDLKAGMTFGRINKLANMGSALFLGYDRFGQQLASINKTGDVFSFNPFNQQFLRQLKLLSGEYAGSRSVLHSASTNTSGDLFMIGLQEVFIPKGGMQGRNQPERRNMIIAYDWASGQEVKRVPLRFRPDGMTMGPGPKHVAYYSADSRTINLLNIDKAEVSSSVAVDERPSAIAFSDDFTLLAVGTVSGNVYLYEVVRNNPVDVKITRPLLNRNLTDQVVKESMLQVEGEIEGTEKIAKVFVNGTPSTLGANRNFSSQVPLEKGKNRIKISVQNTQGQVTEKDFYVTHEPALTAKKEEHAKSFGKRMALVIGNANYASAAKLNNTINDANSMSETLKSLGFEVIKVLDGDYEKMKVAIYNFGDQIEDVDVSLFYYAGHGLEVDGTNYLVPVDANISSALDVKLKTIPLTGVLRTMEFTNEEGLNMIILDACRNNPFPTGKRSGGQGLARVQAPSGTLIAYATDPGSVASDGDKSNGLYTGELVKQMRVSQRIEDVFMNTRVAVEKVSNGSQRPWEEARLKGVFYLH